MLCKIELQSQLAIFCIVLGACLIWLRGNCFSCLHCLQADSIFNLRRPHDLVALLSQERRAALLESLKGELLLMKDRIDEVEDDAGQDTDVKS